MRVRMLKSSGVLLIAVLAATCSEQGSVPPLPNAPTGSLTAKPGASVTVDFGRDHLGSEFPPPLGHDQSVHAKDKISPRNVVIDAGSTVTFRMGVSGVHQVAIYQPGTEPEDIRTVPPFLSPAETGCPPVPRINDPQNRVAVVSAQVCAGGSAAPSFTFTTPGKYLVICTFLPHFNIGMYAWVTVRD